MWAVAERQLGSSIYSAVEHETLVCSVGPIIECIPRLRYSLLYYFALFSGGWLILLSSVLPTRVLLSGCSLGGGAQFDVPVLFPVFVLSLLPYGSPVSDQGGNNQPTKNHTWLGHRNDLTGQQGSSDNETGQ